MPAAAEWKRWETKIEVPADVSYARPILRLAGALAAADGYTIYNFSPEQLINTVMGREDFRKFMPLANEVGRAARVAVGPVRACGADRQCR